MANNVFFTSDLHIGHRNIIKLCDRPYDSIEEMDEALVENWNSVVGKNDRVFHVGDFAYRCSVQHAQEILVRLNGQKFAILGNHDQLAYQLDDWQWVRQHEIRKINKQKIHFYHWPLLEWQGSYGGGWMIHGHQHNKDLEAYKANRHSNRIMDVGVDMHGYAPIHFDELAIHMD